MTALDVKKAMFGDFIEWLKEKEIGDHFSQDVWMSKAFDILYQQYRGSRDFDRAVLGMPPDQFAAYAAAREARAKPGAKLEVVG